MYAFYIAIAIMLSVALSLLAIPYIQSRALLTLHFALPSAFVCIASLALYFFYGNPIGLQQWLTEGKAHYDLLVEVNQYGGMNAIIAEVTDKLAAHPDDAQGWFVLGKLYLAMHAYDDANDALTKARQLEPNDPQIEHYYQLANAPPEQK